MEEKELKIVIEDDNIQKRIQNLFKERAPQFTASLLAVANSNPTVAKCEPLTVINAAFTAASLDLPINNNLGFAAIVPYWDSYSKTFKAQFQIMWKGFIQLAQRSGQYKTISVVPVYDGQLIETNPLKGFVWNWDVEQKGEPVGYAAYFELLNGFEKTLYMTVKQVRDHGEKYSQSFRKDLKEKTKKSLWSTDFDSMALKTVLKQLISKFGPMSTSMEKALQTDQAVVTDKETVVYIDNGVDDELASEEEVDKIVAANIKEMVRGSDDTEV